jgi:hypothetical protein
VFAAPRAYWINIGALTSAFAVIKPSNSTYQSLIAKINGPDNVDLGADMDFMNREYDLIF